MQTILSDNQINQKIDRLAHQLIENCFEEEQVFIGGIKGNGFELAKRIQSIINDEGSVKSELFEIEINKDEPWIDTINLSIETSKLKNGYIVLIDDVLNSGKTMQYALAEFLKFPTKAIKTLTLVDRKHRRFPIKADFVGLSLSTTLKEHVEIILEDGNQKAYLK